MRLSHGPGHSPRSFRAGALALALLAAGCAVKSAEPMAPSSEATTAAPAADAAAAGSEAAPAQAPAPVTSADERDPVIALAEAEGALDRALRGATPSPSRARADEGGEKKAEAQPRTAPEAEGGDGCEVACRALASMRRSAARLCDLAAGGEAGRCDDARARVTRAEGRVKERCPACHATGEP